MSRGTILVKPVLFCAPVFFTSTYWAESAHSWDWVKAEAPLDEKPWAEIKVSLDVTLGEVFAVACDAWGLQMGADDARRGVTREREFFRFAFVRPDMDAAGVSAGDAYKWPPTLPVAREDGTVEQVPALQVTFRELLASSYLGILEGDVTKPYVHPVRPQGDPALIAAIVKLTVHAIHAAYAAVDARVGFAEHIIRLVNSSAPTIKHAENEVIDEAQRWGWVVMIVNSLRKRWRKRRKRDPTRREGGD